MQVGMRSCGASLAVALLSFMALGQIQAANALEVWQLPATTVPVPKDGYPAASGVNDTQAAALQAAMQTGVFNVATEAEFKAAMDAGIHHLIIREHLDLRGLPWAPAPSPTLFQLNPDMQSIQVRTLRKL